jgi:hypothetical protein
VHLASARPERLANSVADGVRAPSVLSVRPERLVNSVAVRIRDDRDLVNSF